MPWCAALALCSASVQPQLLVVRPVLLTASEYSHTIAGRRTISPSFVGLVRTHPTESVALALALLWFYRPSTIRPSHRRITIRHHRWRCRRCDASRARAKRDETGERHTQEGVGGLFRDL